MTVSQWSHDQLQVTWLFTMISWHITWQLTKCHMTVSQHEFKLGTARDKNVHSTIEKNLQEW